MSWLSYWITTIATVVIGIPVMWTWKYLAHVRRRRQYFLALSPQAIAEINHRKLLTLSKGKGTIHQSDQHKEQT